jgi:hypothetical protein
VASQQATVSQTLAITSTQVAVAIVGSIIASALITILLYFLIARIKRKRSMRAKKRTPLDSPHPEYPDDTKFNSNNSKYDSRNGTFNSKDEAGTTIAASQASYTPRGCEQNTLSLFPKAKSGDNPFADRNSIKSTVVPWNPQNPPKPPSLNSWLKVQDGVSPFGPINLPIDQKSKSPLGGQLKSPLQSIMNKDTTQQAPQITTTVRSPTLPFRSPGTIQKPPQQKDPRKSASIFAQPTPSTLEERGPTSQNIRMPNLKYRNPELTRQSSVKSARSVERKPVSSAAAPNPSPESNYDNRESTLSKASVWTDDVMSPGSPSPLPTIVKQEVTTNKTPLTERVPDSFMKIPTPTAPVRTTAEWLSGLTSVSRMSRQSQASLVDNRPAGQSGTQRLGLPSGPRPGGDRLLPPGSALGKRGLSRFIDPRDMGFSRYSSSASGDSRANTPGVGKAL